MFLVVEYPQAFLNLHNITTLVKLMKLQQPAHRLFSQF